MWKEFKEFISKGNVMDLAVGVVIGGAFSSIVNSLVNDIIMPIVGVITGGVDFSNLTWQVKDATVSYGLFIQNVVNFFIIAMCIFLVIRFINKLNKRLEEERKRLFEKNDEEELAEEAEPEVSEEIKLLREINDSLKKANKASKK